MTYKTACVADLLGGVLREELVGEGFAQGRRVADDCQYVVHVGHGEEEQQQRILRHTPASRGCSSQLQ